MQSAGPTFEVASCLSSGAIGARFRIMDCLGRGGSGAVYRAFDRELGGVVALKHLVHASSAAAVAFRESFRLLASVHHPNLVLLHELLELDAQCLLTMELVEGTGLFRWLGILDGNEAPTPSASDAVEGDAPPHRPAARSVREIASLFWQLASGLEALHAAGALHRDIKPSNVRVERGTGRVVLLDFGLVLAMGNAANDRRAGTPHYMAPEQARGEPLTPAADWYAFGVMLYEALTGMRPFAGTPRAVLLAKDRCEPTAPSLIAPGLPRELDDLCTALLRSNAGARPSGGLVREVLARVAGTSPSWRPSAGASLTEAAPPFVGRLAELDGLRSRCPCASPWTPPTSRRSTGRGSARCTARA